MVDRSVRMINKKRKALIVGLAALSVLSTRAYAEELGLEGILRRAAEANSAVKVSELDIKIKEKSKNKALKNLILPPINFSTEEDWEIVKDEGIGFKEVEAYIPIFQGGKMMYG
ncbi:MAG: hypothetical protein ACRC4Z_00950, partial [Fusobacteriaceae bacterium]